MTELTVNVHHLEVNHLDALFLDQVHNILYSFAHRNAPFGFYFVLLFLLYPILFSSQYFCGNCCQKSLLPV